MCASFSISQVYVSVCVRYSCLFGAICVWIKKCSLSNFSWWRKGCCYIFFVLWPPPLHLCTAWLSCWFLQCLCTIRFSVGSFLVGGMFLYPYSCIACGAVDIFDPFCYGILWFEICYLYNYYWPLYYFSWKFWLGDYDWGSACLLDLGSPYWYLMLCICCKAGWTKLYFYFCVLACFWKNYRIICA